MLLTGLEWGGGEGVELAYVQLYDVKNSCVQFIGNSWAKFSMLPESVCWIYFAFIIFKGDTSAEGIFIDYAFNIVLCQHFWNSLFWTLQFESTLDDLDVRSRSQFFSFSFNLKCHCSAQKSPYTLRLVSQQSPQDCPRNSANICLVEHRSFLTSEGGMSATSFLHPSFPQAINAVMLWPVHVQRVPQASEHLCPAKLQTRCDMCCAFQSICPFIPTDSGVSRTVDPQMSL